MPTGSDQEKTEPATPKRREEAREEGRVLQSREVPTALILLSSLMVFYFLTSSIIYLLLNVMSEIFGNLDVIELNPAVVYSHFYRTITTIVKVLIPFTVVMLCVGLGANIIQKGFLFTLKPLAPNFSKIDPIKGFKKLFSLTSFVELIKSILKILIIGLIVTLVVKGEISSFPTLIQMELKGMLVYIGSVTSKIILYVGLAMGGLALLDYMYQRWDYERGLKMSKQEVKDEYKQREGDPQVKARIKSLQRQWARQRMMEKVKEADVVITNPTHLAIAIQYESGKMIAPIVVAKGSGFIAQRIKDIARDTGVPVVENRFVAALLFKTVEIGQTIPQELYKAVAEILAYVYKLKGKV